MFKKLKIHPLVLTGVLLTIGLSFTDYYGIAYFISILLLAVNLPEVRWFQTLFSRLVISSLLLAAIIMITAMLSWIMNVKLIPVLVAFVILLLGFSLSKIRSKPKALVDFGDYVSIIMALLLPFIIYVSYFFPSFNNWSLYQLLSNGWDHSSHIVMIETAGIENSYVYGKYDEVRHRTIVEAQAYPQGWHLASAHIANGFSDKNLYSPDQPFKALWAYAITVLVWYMMGAYLLSKITWSILRLLAKKTHRRVGKTDLFFFVISNVMIQSVTVTAALIDGFANYIGLIVFALLLTAYIFNGKPTHPMYIIIASLICAGGILCWFLPAPALLIILLTYVLHLDRTKIPKAQFVLYLAISAAICITACVQMYVFVTFSEVSANTQLVAKGGVHSIKELFILFIVLASLLYVYINKNTSIAKQLSISAAITLIPVSLLILLIYFYQTATQGDASYYYYKLTTLLVVMMSILFIPAITLLLKMLREKILHDKIISTTMCILLLGGALLVTQQSLDTYYYVFQKNSNLSSSTAQAVTNYLEKEDVTKTKLIVLTDRSREVGPKRNETFNGDLAANMIHQPLTCVFYSVHTPNISQKFKARFSRIARCAKSLPEKDVLIITNRATYKQAMMINNPNVRVINIK